jgi:hypothetical protein
MVSFRELFVCAKDLFIAATLAIFATGMTGAPDRLLIQTDHDSTKVE